MQQSADRAERRRVERKKVLLAARLRLAHGLYIPCTVIDISPMGAGIALDVDLFVPLQFRLQIPADLFEAECVLRRRNAANIGVEFLSARAEALARYG